MRVGTTNREGYVGENCTGRTIIHETQGHASAAVTHRIIFVYIRKQPCFGTGANTHPTELLARRVY